MTNRKAPTSRMNGRNVCSSVHHSGSFWWSTFVCTPASRSCFMMAAASCLAYVARNLSPFVSSPVTAPSRSATTTFLSSPAAMRFSN